MIVDIFLTVLAILPLAMLGLWFLTWFVTLMNSGDDLIRGFKNWKSGLRCMSKLNIIDGFTSTINTTYVNGKQYNINDYDWFISLHSEKEAYCFRKEKQQVGHIELFTPSMDTWKFTKDGKGDWNTEHFFLKSNPEFIHWYYFNKTMKKFKSFHKKEVQLMDINESVENSLNKALKRSYRTNRLKDLLDV